MFRKLENKKVFFLFVLISLRGFQPLGAQTLQVKMTDLPDSVVISTSESYGDPSLFRQVMLGRNYREAWETPVTLPVFNLSALGLTVKELGGGRQTKSLRLLDKDSLEWALRTIDKDVRPAIPKIIRNKMVVSIVQDMVSAAHPFAPLTLPLLAEAVGLHPAKSRFYFVPDDPALGEYRQLFAGQVCMLEKRDLLPGYKLKNTEKVVEQLLTDEHHAVSQADFLKARIFDMLIADWDRHYDQWKWAETEGGGKTVYLPLPKDRDQAYFNSNGWLLKFIRLFGMKYMVGFTQKTDNLVKLNGIAWGLDRLLLNALSAGEWKTIAAHFQQSLTDDVIQEAVRQLPAQLYALHGNEITQKLLLRRNTIANDLSTYYRFLSKDVTIYGTDKDEKFELSGNADSLTVIVRSRKNLSEILYRRTFNPTDTKKIRLLGLGGNDIFTSENGLNPGIKIRIDGGTGANEYQLADKLEVEAKDSKMDAALYLKQLEKPLRIRKEEKD